LIRSANIN
ncbi:hypothetical protein AVEN_107923-1, partial [Araneus ventricosus]